MCVDSFGQRSLRLCQVMSDKIGAFEEEEYITEALTLQRTVQSNPVSILKGTHTYTRTHKHTRMC